MWKICRRKNGARVVLSPVVPGADVACEWDVLLRVEIVLPCSVDESVRVQKGGEGRPVTKWSP